MTSLLGLCGSGVHPITHMQLEEMHYMTVANLVDFATKEEERIEQDYAALRVILNEAFDFAAKGKGAVRHGNGKPWHAQPHFEIAQEVGTGFAVGQALKKLREGFSLEDYPATRREWLGAISYIASAIYAGDQGIE